MRNGRQLSCFLWLEECAPVMEDLGVLREEKGLQSLEFCEERRTSTGVL